MAQHRRMTVDNVLDEIDGNSSDYEGLESDDDDDFDATQQTTNLQLQQVYAFYNKLFIYSLMYIHVQYKLYRPPHISTYLQLSLYSVHTNLCTYTTV